ncbi:MAG: nitroreductase family protein [Thermoplasmata archaeon]|nr:MAG: nitroreductase family protein [Thermoplasmata archaeon]
MELEDAILSRRSIRRFKGTDIPEEAVTRLLELASAAPSAGNLQARDFVVVRNKDTRRALSNAALGQEFVAEAPVVVVVCGNKSRSGRHYGSRGKELYYIQDADAAIENLLLAIHGAGYGSCWVGAFEEKAVSKVLKLPGDIRPLAIIPIGVPASPAKSSGKPARYPLDKLVHYEKW